MLPILLLAGVAGAVAALKRGAGQLPPGQNPFDTFPPGVSSAAPLYTDDFKASSGHRYKLTVYAVADGRSYVVAEKRGDVDWLSYLVSQNGQRELCFANADKHEEILEMRADFQLAGGAVT